MKQKETSPSILQDIGAVAGLYKNVVWMLGQQLRHGSEWQQHLFDESTRYPRSGETRERDLAHTRRN
jgi:hypothetical protein